MNLDGSLRRLLLYCGLVSPCIYLLTDLVAGLSYPGYSFTAQAISELFAIGAPPTAFVVPIFTLTSIINLGFSMGVLVSARGSKAIKMTAVLFAIGVFNGLLLWNVFPMHMRGAEASFTDLMHILLAGVGVVIVLMVVAITAFSQGGRLRTYSLIALLIILIPGSLVFAMVPGLTLGEPTPYVDLTERFSTYGYYVWQALYIKFLIG